MTKQKLYGGRSTKNVFKDGDTVVRPHKKESEFANGVLQFLQHNGYKYSQRFITQDADKNDVYQYVNGFVPDEIGFTTIEQLSEFMRIVRQFHDISREFLNNGKVICHNDLSPCNVVFVEAKPVCIIDWDSVAIGERWEDITYILWLWINIGSHSKDKIDILQQMEIALIAYGADSNTTDNLAKKLIWRMDKVKSEMKEDNYQYVRTCDWVEFSKKWVEDNKEKINLLMRG